VLPFLERAPDGHRFADASSVATSRESAANQPNRLREFLEGKTRNSGDDVINAGSKLAGVLRVMAFDRLTDIRLWRSLSRMVFVETLTFTKRVLQLMDDEGLFGVAGVSGEATRRR
jgi:hypothetical protein